MEKQQNFLPKKKRTFFDWLILRGILRKNPKFHFTVPTHICTLKQCGCERDKNDPPFIIKIVNGNLFHHKNWRVSCLLEDGEFLKSFLTTEEAALLAEKSSTKKHSPSSKKTKELESEGHHYFC